MNQEKITFKNSKDQKLVGVLYSPDSEDFPIAIYVHGYGSDKSSAKALGLAKVLIQEGIGLFTIDLSGRGESEGNFEDTTITQYIDDVRCAIDKVTEFTDKIALIGNSLGGLIALQEAIKNNRLKVLILISPVSRFPHKSRRREFSPKGIQEWKEKGHTFVESGRFGLLKLNYAYYEDALKYGRISDYKNIQIPTLVTQGTEDKSIPLNETKELVNILEDCKLILIDGADHNYTNPEDFEKMINETVNFLIEVLK